MVTDKDAALLESMLTFYDQFARQNQENVHLQKDTARAYRRVGDIQRRLGQYDKAETAYRHALKIYQTLAGTADKNGEHLTSVAAIYNELGTIFRDTGRLTEARDAHRQAQETLDKEPPKVAALPESRFELAKTYSYLSVPFRGRGRGSSGAAGPRHANEHSEGHDWWNHLPAATPARAGQANNPFPHGAHASARGEEARENNRKALEILRKLIGESPDNSDYRLALARSQRDHYLIAAFTGHKLEADQARQEATDILESLVANAPRNPDYRYELAETYAMPYPRPRDGKPPQDAGRQLGRAVEIGSELTTHYPTVPQYKASLARSYLRLAEAARASDSPAKAEDNLTKAVGLQKSLAAEFAAVAAYRFTLARSLSQLAGIQIARHELPQARASLEAAIAASKQIQQSAPEAHFLHGMMAMQYASLARVLRELGESKLADEAEAKAKETGHHRGSSFFGPFHHDRQRPAPDKVDTDGKYLDAPPGYDGAENLPGYHSVVVARKVPEELQDPDGPVPADYLIAVIDVLGFSRRLETVGSTDRSSFRFGC